MKYKKFSLIVGTDSITDTRAVEKLIQLQGMYPRLEVSALVNDDRPLFHPKLAWFENGSSLSVILGSGNLTQGGLFGNWEAFVVSTHPIDELDSLRLSIEDWIEDANPGLLPISDPRVLARVAENSGDERSVKKPSAAPDTVPLASSDYASWLVAELNKSRKTPNGEPMFSQASFDAETFKRFFDYTGAEVDIVLWPVNSDGTLDALESRKGRYKAASVNYYFELGSVQGMAYPASARPIAVFGKLNGGGYTYRVVLPGEAGHAELEAWLIANASAARPSFMKRAVLTTQQLHEAWPLNPMATAHAPGS